jgi:ABC-type sugar transport system ATPase subunit
MTEPEAEQSDDFITATDVRKHFGGVAALAGASLTVRRGTIHAMVGENGAGKSTLLGAIAGRLMVDSGTILVNGRDATRMTPRLARSLGVAAIYQELTIIPALTACANVYLGNTPARGTMIQRGLIRQRFDALCKRIGISIPANSPAGQLSIADQQMLEIMRALESGARMILLDEPTASLVQAQRDNLFRIMRELRSDGVTMVLVSHNLAEVLAISDQVTVLRNGATVTAGPVLQWNRNSLIAAMLGKAAPDLLASHRAKGPLETDELLQVHDLHVPGVLDEISLRARRGEILGVAGLVGSGRTTLLRAIAGLEPSATGELVVDGKRTRWPTSVIRSLNYGIALVPEDRKGQGLMLHMSSRENVGISSLKRFSRFGYVLRGQMKRTVRELLQQYRLDASRIEQPVRNLSGGNQQKVLLARWQLKKPKVLLADEPTRGIDVGAKAAVLTSLRAFADAGATVIVVSSELEELTVLADRVVVLTQGKLVTELSAGTTGVSVDSMLSAAFVR